MSSAVRNIRTIVEAFCRGAVELNMQNGMTHNYCQARTHFKGDGTRCLSLLNQTGPSSIFQRYRPCVPDVVYGLSDLSLKT